MDLFELLPAKRKYNTSWNPNEPRIEEQDHKHYYRSHDDKGHPSDKATYQADHTHAIEVDWSKKGPDGGPLVKCGPPVRRGLKSLPSGRKARGLNPIKWVREIVRGGDVELQEIVDNHTHDIVYRGSQIVQERGAPNLTDEQIADQFKLRAPQPTTAGVKITE